MVELFYSIRMQSDTTTYRQTSDALAPFDGFMCKRGVTGVAGGPLDGLSFAAKDLFDVRGERTGAGNPDWLKTHEPAGAHAAAIEMLLRAGASLVGKTCTDELAFSLDGINVHYGTPLNPQSPESIPGGSSSGSASVVASQLVDFAIGTDTAGSVRVPAAYCGIFGFRPTHGRISTQGIVPLGPSFDTVGWFAREAGLLTRCGRVLLRFSADEKAQAAPRKLIVLESGFALLESDLRKKLKGAIDKIAPMFSDVVEWAPGVEQLQDWVNCFNVVRGWETWQCHGEWLKHEDPTMSDTIKERFLMCENITEDDFQQGSKHREKIIASILDTMGGADAVICLPTTCGRPPAKAESAEILSANRKRNMLLNVMASIAGLPQVAIPTPLSDSFRTSLSLVGAPNSDERLLQLSELIAAQIVNSAV